MWEKLARLRTWAGGVGRGLAFFFEGEHYLAWAIFLTTIALAFFLGSPFPSSILYPPFSILGAALSFAACLVVLVRDWRASLGALMAQYLLAWLILGGIIRLEVAFIKVIVGALACLILYLTSRHLIPSRGFRGKGNLSFRLMLTFFGGLVSFYLFQRYPLAEVSPSILFAAYWVMVMGVFTLIITGEAFGAGVGLLTFELGFELIYTALDPGLVVAGLFGAVNLMLALAIAYLSTISRESPPSRLSPQIEEER